MTSPRTPNRNAGKERNHLGKHRPRGFPPLPKIKKGDRVYFGNKFHIIRLVGNSTFIITNVNPSNYSTKTKVIPKSNIPKNASIFVV